MVDTCSEIKGLLKIASFFKNVVLKLPTFQRLKYLFGPLIGRKRLVYISLPSFYIECVNKKAFRAYKKRYPMPGNVRSDLPWIRPHDSNAASDIKVLLSDFAGDISILPDEDIVGKMIHENLVCIGGQTNWVFWQFVIQKKCLLPLEYRIDRQGGFDGFYDVETDKCYESGDRDYAYGLLAVIKNTQAHNRRIVFISGLDADVTMYITKTLRHNLKKIRQSAKLGIFGYPEFYCIFRFKRTGDRKVPLLFNDIIIRKIRSRTG